MRRQAEITILDAPSRSISRAALKFFRDAWSVLEMKILFLLRAWYWYVIRPLVFPLGVLFWLRVMVPNDPEANTRILAGAIVFGVSLSSANMLSQQILQDRFLGRLKLLITMPMSKSAYAVGVMTFSTIQTTPIIVLLLAFSSFVGVNLHLTWAFIPLVVTAMLTISGIALLIGSYAPNIEVGGIMSNLFGVVLVMVSPVFFTMDQAPFVLKLIGWVSPMRYAADGLTQSISGNGDIWTEIGILSAFAIASMALGLRKLRWRDE